MQRRILAIEHAREVRQEGRIRIGDKVMMAGTNKNGEQKSRPAMRETFRLTTSNKSALDMAAQVYGGEVRRWEGHPGQWELCTQSAEIKVIISTRQSCSQAFELWSGGGCVRRCDGVSVETADKDGNRDVKPCLCNPEERQCALTTRVSVILAEIPSLGLWRLDTKGKIAGSELPAFFEQLEDMGLVGVPICCIMGIHQQEIKKPGEQPKKFAIPTLAVDPNPPNWGETLRKVIAQAVTDAPALTQRHTVAGPSLTLSTAPLLVQRNEGSEPSAQTARPAGPDLSQMSAEEKQEHLRRQDSETAAKAWLQENGLTKNTHREAFEGFKTACKDKFWPDILLGGVEKGHATLDALTTYAATVCDPFKDDSEVIEGVIVEESAPPAQGSLV